MPSVEQPNRISPKPSKSLWRAITAPDVDLSADEAASTFFRFFRSRHVADLRLIFKAAVGVFLVHVVIVLVLGSAELRLSLADINAERVGSVGSPGADSKPDPAGKAETAGKNDRGGSGKKHAWKDLIEFVSKYIGAGLPIYGGIIAWAYLTASARLGIVDLFACEIGTLCRVGTIVDIGKRYVDQAGFARPDDHVKFGQRSAASGNFVAQENYFPVFASNSKELQPLEAMVVTHITEFYTFMKAMRDSQRKLAELKLSPDVKANATAEMIEANLEAQRDTLANVIFMMFLGYESARKAVKDLIEFEPTAAENMMVILITELKCYCFLVDYFKGDDLRHSRLELRRSGYKTIVEDLLYKVEDSPKAYPEDWERAVHTLSELKKRYGEVCVGPHAIPMMATRKLDSTAH
jgi:hypothetical protein